MLNNSTNAIATVPIREIRPQVIIVITIHKPDTDCIMLCYIAFGLLLSSPSKVGVRHS